MSYDCPTSPSLRGVLAHKLVLLCSGFQVSENVSEIEIDLDYWQMCFGSN